MKIGENIKQLRLMHGMSQKQFAVIADVTDKAISTWEQGTHTPRMSAIQKIADHFGISKSSIIEENGLDDIDIFPLPSKKSREIVLTDEQTKVLSAFDSLNSEGRKMLLDYLNYLRYSHSGASALGGNINVPVIAHTY